MIPTPTADVELDRTLQPQTESEPEAPFSSLLDLDGDRLSNADEVSMYGTNFAVADTDGDGVNDGDEVDAGTDPLDPSDV